MGWGTYIRKMKMVNCPSCLTPHEATRSDAKCPSCHKKRYAIKAAKFRAENPELAIAKLSDWRKSNAEHTKAYGKKYRAENKGARVALQMKRQAAQKNRTPKWANLDHIKGMYELCGLFRSVGVMLEVDHVVPLKGKTVSGLHVENNLQLLHEKLNGIKKNKFSELNDGY